MLDTFCLNKIVALMTSHMPLIMLTSESFYILSRKAFRLTGTYDMLLPALSTPQQRSGPWPRGPAPFQ